MERVLVTGGAGFIGSYVVEALLALGCTVMSYDCLVRQVHPKSPQWPSYQPAQDRLVLHFGDVRDPRAMSYALADFRPDTVIHLAARVGVGQSQHEVAQYVSTNVTGTANLLQQVLDYNRQARENVAQIELLEAKQAIPEEGQSAEEAQRIFNERIRPMIEDLRAKPCTPIQQVLIAGSMSAYGEGSYRMPDPPAGLVVDQEMFENIRPPKGWHPSPAAWDPPNLEPMGTPEWVRLQPASIYAWSKEQQEALALLVWRTRGAAEGLAIKVARFFNAYGPRQALGNPYTGACAIFAARIAAGLAPLIYEDGGQRRDFTHVRDVATAVLAILDKGEAGITYNVGTGRPTTILDVARTLCEGEVGTEGEPLTPTVTGVYRVGDIRHCYADTTRLQGLGWEPQVSLEAGLDEFKAWARSQPPEDKDLLNQASTELVLHNLLRA